jgi:hypothetical protein
LRNGHHSDDRGHITVGEAIARYNAPLAQVTEPSLLIIVNKLYRRGMSKQELYEITRKSWKIAPLRRKPQYAVAVYNCIVQQVYAIEKWECVDQQARRWAFEGRVAQDLQHYLHKSVAQHIAVGAQNPVKYING